MTRTVPEPATASTTPGNTRGGGSLLRTTALAGIAAAATVTVAAAIAHAAGVSLKVEGQMIPLGAFAVFTLISAALGGVLLAVLNRTGRPSRRSFVAVTVALTVLSCIPAVAKPDETSTAVTLVALHLIAAAIVIPALLRHARS